MSLATTMMDSSATLKRPTISRDVKQGVLQDPFRVVFSNRPCSLRQNTSGEMKLYDQRQGQTSCTVFFLQDPDAQINDILLVTNCRTQTTDKLLVTSDSRSDTHGRVWEVSATTIEAPH